MNARITPCLQADTTVAECPGVSDWWQRRHADPLRAASSCDQAIGSARGWQ
ncbi:MAG: hypothetical protein ABIR94_01635 [Rubrivivax sp.]